MNKGIWVIIVLVVLAGGYFLLRGSYQTPSPSPQLTTQPATDTALVEQSNQITVQNFSFSPAEITVSKGTTITWTNQDSVAHTVTSDSGTMLNSEMLSNGSSYSVVFETPGEYSYHCTPHPNMRGKVTVTP